jgi:hypothetical protein
MSLLHISPEALGHVVLVAVQHVPPVRDAVGQKFLFASMHSFLHIRESVILWRILGRKFYPTEEDFTD